MSLRNSHTAELTVTQIAAHLQTSPWNITRQLQKFTGGDATRLQGFKVYDGGPGRGGQWRIWRHDYLNFLRIPVADIAAADRPDAEKIGAAGPDGLPTLHRFDMAARQLGITEQHLAAKVQQLRWPHITFGRSKYLTYHQQQRLQVLAEDEQWAARPHGPARSPDLPRIPAAGPGAGSIH